MILLLQTATVIAIVAASPVAPWWAAPIYVSTFEHIAIAFITVTVPAGVAAGVQIYYGRDARKDRLAKRLESHIEHGRGIEEAKAREVALAAKVENAALHMADKVEATTAMISGKLDENTAVTHEAKDGALRAYNEANSVNLKIAETNERITDVLNAGKK